MKPYKSTYLQKTCDYKEFLKKALRSQLVCSLRSKAIQKCLLAEVELDLKKALEISQAMEAATKQTMKLQGDHLLTQQNICIGTSKATY